ncbi:MAG: hypothetical protein PUP92_24915 [Rhizonema sp. PD38]|nr:hypothetical protein [Rhizonema sp. PD38]
MAVTVMFSSIADTGYKDSTLKTLEARALHHPSGDARSDARASLPLTLEDSLTLTAVA